MPGVRIEDCGLKAGLNGVDNGRLWFDRRAGPARRAARPLRRRWPPTARYSTPIENQTKRFFTMLGTLIQGRISVAGGAGSATKVALAIAVRYAERRRQFDAPGRDGEIVLLDYLAHQRKLLPALATTYALHFAQARARRRRCTTSFTDGDPADPTTAGASWRPGPPASRRSPPGTPPRTIQTCREACGGAGYLAENRLPGLKADTDVFTTFEGDNTVLLQLVAKELLTSYRDHFGELDVLGTVRFVADQAVGTVLERTRRPLIAWCSGCSTRAGRDEDADWLDRGWQLSLFDFRERHLLERAGPAAAQGGRRAATRSPCSTQRQDHLLAAAQAHVDRLLLEAFVAGIDGCAEPAVAASCSDGSATCTR